MVADVTGDPPFTVLATPCHTGSLVKDPCPSSWPAATPIPDDAPHPHPAVLAEHRHRHALRRLPPAQLGSPHLARASIAPRARRTPPPKHLMGQTACCGRSCTRTIAPASTTTAPTFNAARRGVEFLFEHFHDREHGGWRWRTTQRVGRSTSARACAGSSWSCSRSSSTPRRGPATHLVAEHAHATYDLIDAHLRDGSTVGGSKRPESGSRWARTATGRTASGRKLSGWSVASA